jgi:hypothetical protein
MMRKVTGTHILVKVVAAVALCSVVVFADWFAGEPVQQAAEPAPVAAEPVPAAAVPAPVHAPDPAHAPVQAVEHVAEQPAAAVPEVVQSGIIDVQSDVRGGTEISAEALASAPYLHFDRRNLPGEGRVLPPKDRTVFQLFDRITVKPAGRKLTVKDGDTVDVFNKMRWFSFNGRPVLLTMRVGRGVVVGYAGDRAVVSLHEIWSEISGGESIAKTTSFTPFRCENLTASGAGSIRAAVVQRVEQTVVPYLHQYLIIDKGTDAGVRMGDFFKVMERSKPRRLSEELLKGQVIHVSPASATLVVQKLRGNQVSVGDEAILSLRSE